MKTKTKSRRRGRPSLPDDKKTIVTGVSLPPDLLAKAREIGHGNLSRGVQDAIRSFRVVTFPPDV